MNKSLKSSLQLLLIIALIGSVSVSLSETNPQPISKSVLHKSVKDGNVQTILLMGKTNNQEDIKILKEALTNQISKISTGMENPRVIRALRKALAKCKDRIERQRILDSLSSNDPIIQLHACEDAEYVGGNDMIQKLATLLDDPSGYKSLHSDIQTSPDKIPQGDVLIPPISVLAAKALANLIDVGPMPPIGPDKKGYTEKDVEAWSEWWKINKNRFPIE